jgi:hypothetical protein
MNKWATGLAGGLRIEAHPVLEASNRMAGVAVGQIHDEGALPLPSTVAATAASRRLC